MRQAGIARAQGVLAARHAVAALRHGRAKGTDVACRQGHVLPQALGQLTHGDAPAAQWCVPVVRQACGEVSVAEAYRDKGRSAHGAVAAYGSVQLLERACAGRREEHTKELSHRDLRVCGVMLALRGVSIGAKTK